MIGIAAGCSSSAPDRPGARSPFARLLVSLALLLPLAGAVAAELSPYETEGEPVARGPIDRFVFARLKTLNIQPARNCSDEVFVRRIHFDLIGTLPTASAVREFLADQAPDKRAALVDRLMARPEFADYWGMKWCDLLRVKAEFPINLWPNSVQSYDHWIRTCVRDNVPYDRFARELLTTSGSNFRAPPANFYRAVVMKDADTLARMAALTFMGTRLEKWPTNDAAGVAAFFARVGFKATGEWKEEIVYFDAFATNAPAYGQLPGGKRAKLTPDRDPRELFADWLIDEDNPWFARNIANRVWSWLLGRGLIHEPDDIRSDNPAVHPDVLAYLEKELVASKYDLRHLFRLILGSQTYQLSSVPRSTDPKVQTHFAAYALRRLDAEVLVDALCQLTGTTEKYSSPIPEPFTFIPEDHRSIQLPDGSITSAFLEMYGRPSRDSGLETERNNQPTAAQRLHLLNSSHIRRKFEQSDKIRALVKPDLKPREVATRIYMTILSRPPTAEELKAVADYTKPSGGYSANRDAANDVVWALINSPEFLYRH